MAMLLYYNLHGEREAKIRLMAMRFAIALKPVRREEYGQTLGALCGLVPENPAPDATEDFTDEMLVLAGFDQALLNEFLQAFRRAKLPPVRLKAMLTETNQDWNSTELHREIVREHEAMHAGQTAHTTQT